MKKKYYDVDTMEKVKNLAKLLKESDYIAYDTETNGLFVKKNVVIGASFSINDQEGYYIPFLSWKPNKETAKNRTSKGEKYVQYQDGTFVNHWTGEEYPEDVTQKQFDLKKEFPWFTKFLNKCLKGKRLLMWNAPFDVCMTKNNAGVDLCDDLFCDGSLLAHIIDENAKVGLKANIVKYADSLGIDAYAEAAVEKKELSISIRNNGGRPSKDLWRASHKYMVKYASADTIYTFALCRLLLKRLKKDFGKNGVEWFFKNEVMPLCKEVVIPMKNHGVRIDVEHFQALETELSTKLDDIETNLLSYFSKKGWLNGLAVPKTAITEKAILLELFELEKIPMPLNAKGAFTTGKKAVTALQDKHQHWVYGYMLGEEEIPYDESKMNKIYQDIYFKKMGKSAFNIKSKVHLAWLLFEKLGLPTDNVGKTPTGRLQVTAEVLGNFQKDYKFIKELLLFNKLQKLYSTYVTPALNLHIDGFLSMDMKQNGTTSGRFACSGGYNLQTLPKVPEITNCNKCDSRDIKFNHEIECIMRVECKECGHISDPIVDSSAIKKGFIAPEGYKIVNADYSSLEPRLFAEISEDQILLDIYKQGLDFYSQFYCQIFDHKGEYSANPKDKNFLKKQAPAKRTMIKPIALGIPYGARDGQVANMAGSFKSYLCPKSGIEKTYPDKEEGKRIRDAYLQTLTGVAKYMRDQELSVISKGYVESRVGRRRHLPNAYTIAKFLAERNIDYDEFIDLPGKVLRGIAIQTKTETNDSFILTFEDLKELTSLLKRDLDVVIKKDGWKYIKNALKGDLDNAKNNPIQALAAHVCNLGMLETTRHFKSRKINGIVVLQIHDEIMCYVKDDEIENGVAALKEGMEDNAYAKSVSVEMIADPQVTENLVDAK